MAYNKRESDRGRRNGSKDFRGRSHARSQMHKATCANCGKQCEVPFKPTGSKPIFCSVCFEKQGGASRDSNSRRSGRSNYSDRTMFKATCEKCGNDCEVPFRPAQGKNVYCSPCFGKGGGSEQSSVETNKQFAVVNAKLDEILKALRSSQPIESEETKMTKPTRLKKDFKKKKKATPKEKKKAVKKKKKAKSSKKK